MRELALVPYRLLSVDPSVVTVAGEKASEDNKSDDDAHVVSSHLGPPGPPLFGRQKMNKVGLTSKDPKAFCDILIDK